MRLCVCVYRVLPKCPEEEVLGTGLSMWSLVLSFQKSDQKVPFSRGAARIPLNKCGPRIWLPEARASPRETLILAVGLAWHQEVLKLHRAF